MKRIIELHEVDPMAVEKEPRAKDFDRLLIWSPSGSKDTSGRISPAAADHTVAAGYVGLAVS